MVYDLPDSILEHAATGRKIPTYRKNGAFRLAVGRETEHEAVEDPDVWRVS